jgi:glycosyltransferase involved in cell wall biosynthesis
MRVLVLHSAYLSGPVSGENRVVEDETRLLSEAGHSVEAWTPSPASNGAYQLVRAGASSIWSRESIGRLRGLLQSFRPEVVHFHNLFPMLSPAVIRIANAAGAATVQTLHNYRSMCLPATLLRGGSICEACVGHLPWRGVVHRCYRGSVAGSVALATSLALHRVIRTPARVDLYLAISRFVKEKHEEAGLSLSGIRVKRHFAWDGPTRAGAGRYFLYVGRLSEEKGLSSLVRNWDHDAGEFLIAGSGPQEGELRGIGRKGVSFTGAVPPSRIQELLVDARALLVPSRWYEGAGKVVLEAYAAGVPVVASRIGALPEVVEEDLSGFLLPPEDPASWLAACKRLLDDRVSMRLGQGARRLWQASFSPDVGLKEMESAYAEAMERQKERTHATG